MSGKLDRQPSSYQQISWIASSTRLWTGCEEETPTIPGGSVCCTGLTNNTSLQIFFKTPALQEWLAEEYVADDLKALATAQITTSASNDEGTRARLSRSYLNRTGEAPQLANGPIDVVVAILVAGYMASVPSDQRPFLGVVQNVTEHIDKRFDHLEESLPQAATDPITQKVHTDQVAQELSIILMVRAFDVLSARRAIQKLRDRVERGDLAAANNPAKNKVRYWTARLCASDNETLALAKQLLKELRQTDPNMDLSIVDGLLAEADGDAAKAFRILRDHDDPDPRSVLFGLMVRSQGERAALDWFEQQDAHSDPQFFTPAGWMIWAVCMARIGKWKEAAKCFLSFESHWQNMPVLAFVEGIINAAMLLPDDHRERGTRERSHLSRRHPKLGGGSRKSSFSRCYLLRGR